MNEKSILVNIRRNYDMLSKHQKVVADFILGDINLATKYSITEIAKECNVSTTTVIRFLNKVGYKSYTNFKRDLIEEASLKKLKQNNSMESLLLDGYKDITSESSMQQIVLSVTHAVSDSMLDLKNLIIVDSLKEETENSKKRLEFLMDENKKYQEVLKLIES